MLQAGKGKIQLSSLLPVASLIVGRVSFPCPRHHMEDEGAEASCPSLVLPGPDLPPTGSALLCLPGEEQVRPALLSAVASEG